MRSDVVGCRRRVALHEQPAGNVHDADGARECDEQVQKCATLPGFRVEFGFPTWGRDSFQRHFEGRQKVSHNDKNRRSSPQPLPPDLRRLWSHRGQREGFRAKPGFKETTFSCMTSG